MQERDVSWIFSMEKSRSNTQPWKNSMEIKEVNMENIPCPWKTFHVHGKHSMSMENIPCPWKIFHASMYTIMMQYHGFFPWRKVVPILAGQFPCHSMEDL